MNLRERDSEDQVAFTLRLLAEVTEKANALPTYNPTSLGQAASC